MRVPLLTIFLVLALCSHSLATAKLRGSLSLRCNDNVSASSFVKLPLASGEEIQFEFTTREAVSYKAADFIAQKCMNARCVAGKGHVKLEHYRADRKAAGVLDVEFPDGRLSAKFEATAHPRIKGYCE